MIACDRLNFFNPPSNTNIKSQENTITPFSCKQQILKWLTKDWLSRNWDKISVLHPSWDFANWVGVGEGAVQTQPNFFRSHSACSAGVFFGRANVSSSWKRHVETEERRKWRESKGAGRGRGERRETPLLVFSFSFLFSLPLFSPPPSPHSFFCPCTYPKGYYFYSPQSSTVIKSKMAATTIRTWFAFSRKNICKDETKTC